MKRLVTLSVLLAALAAEAQVTVPQIAIRRVDSTLDEYVFGASACNDTITVQWTSTLTQQVATTCSMNSLKLWATENECGDAPGTADHQYSSDFVPALTVDRSRQGTFNVTIDELPGFATTTSADGGVVTPCGTPDITKTHKICGSIVYSVSSGISCGTSSTLSATPLSLVYDMQAPSAPTITAQAALDTKVKLNFTTGSDTSSVTIEARASSDAGDTEWAQVGEALASNGVIYGSGLQNTVQYDVRLRATDGAGNVSLPSSEVQLTPIDTLGFWGYYKEQGGSDQGGCSTGLGLVPALIGLLALRRSRKARSTHS